MHEVVHERQLDELSGRHDEVWARVHVHLGRVESHRGRRDGGEVTLCEGGEREEEK